MLDPSRIHGELLKLGIEIGQTSVAKYMARQRRPHPKDGRRSSAIMPMGSPRWTSSSFRHSRFGCSMGLLILQHGRREILWLGRNDASDRRMDKSPTDGGLRLGAGATLSRSRSRQYLRRGIHPAASRHGHSGSANRAAIAMAEWPLGKADRLDPTGMS